MFDVRTQYYALTIIALVISIIVLIFSIAMWIHIGYLYRALGTEVIELKSRVSDFERALREVRSEVLDLRSNVTAVSHRLSVLRNDLEFLASNVSSLSTSISNVEAKLLNVSVVVSRVSRAVKLVEKIGEDIDNLLRLLDNINDTLSKISETLYGRAYGEYTIFKYEPSEVVKEFVSKVVEGRDIELDLQMLCTKISEEISYRRDPSVSGYIKPSTYVVINGLRFYFWKFIENGRETFRTPTETLKLGYGDCDDHANLYLICVDYYLTKRGVDHRFASVGLKIIDTRGRVLGHMICVGWCKLGNVTKWFIVDPTIGVFMSSTDYWSLVNKFKEFVKKELRVDSVPIFDLYPVYVLTTCSSKYIKSQYDDAWRELERLLTWGTPPP